MKHVKLQSRMNEYPHFQKSRPCASAIFLLLPKSHILLACRCAKIIHSIYQVWALHWHIHTTLSVHSAVEANVCWYLNMVRWELMRYRSTTAAFVYSNYIHFQSEIPACLCRWFMSWLELLIEIEWFFGMFENGKTPLQSSKSLINKLDAIW